MEYRETPRRRTDIDVVIECHGLGMVCGRAVDISKGGMFVETGRICLPIHACVDAVLIAQGERPRALHVKAVVVQQKPAGVGLMFGEMEEAARQFLCEITC